MEKSCSSFRYLQNHILFKFFGTRECQIWIKQIWKHLNIFKPFEILKRFKLFSPRRPLLWPRAHRSATPPSPAQRCAARVHAARLRPSAMGRCRPPDRHARPPIPPSFSLLHVGTDLRPPSSFPCLPPHCLKGAARCRCTPFPLPPPFSL
jgi:hypothetical protein